MYYYVCYVMERIGMGQVALKFELLKTQVIQKNSQIVQKNYQVVQKNSRVDQ